MPIFDTYVRTPFRFYDRLEKQHRYLYDVNRAEIDCLYKLINPVNNILLPFMIKRAHTGYSTAQFKVVALSGGAVTTINPALITMISTAEFDYLIYDGNTAIGTALPCDAYYYAYVTDSSNNRWYSEVFYVTNTDLQCYLKLEWTNSCDFNDIYYQGGFTHRLYLDPYAEVIQRESVIVREGKKNGEGEDIFNLQRMTPTHVIETGLIPDYLKDALDFMTLHNSITLTMKHHNGLGVIKNVTMAGKWEFDGSMFNGQIKFEEESIVKVECCDDLIVTNVCHASCYNAYEDPGSGWITGRYYMNYDGRIKEYTGAGFIYHFCSSKIAHNITTNADWCYDDNTLAWYPMPSIINITPNAAGTAHIIRAIGAPGSIIKLYVDTVLTAMLTSEVFSSDGYEIAMTPGQTYAIYITDTTVSPACNYGTSSTINFEAGELFILTNASNYHSMQRLFSVDLVNTFQFNSIQCDGNEQLGSPIVLVLGTNVTYSIGLDGLLHIDQIDDIINANVPAGYRVYDDMRIIEAPAGEVFYTQIDLSVAGPWGTANFSYTYDNVLGFQF